MTQTVPTDGTMLALAGECSGPIFMASASSSGLDVPNWHPWGLFTSQISHSESLVRWFEGQIFEVNLQSVVVTDIADPR